MKGKKVPKSELEIKTHEYGNLPGHILGLDGWLLRSIPQKQRREFLENHLRTLTIVFHPDRVTDKDERKKRENYLQTLSQAVNFLTTDPYAFELSTDSVPTRTNPVVGLRTTLEIKEREINELERQIGVEKEKIGVEKEKNVELASSLTFRSAELKFEEEARAKLNDSFSRMKRFDRWLALNSRLYQITNSPFSVSGRQIVFNEKTVTPLVDMIHADSSRYIISPSAYQRKLDEFSELVEKHHLRGEKKNLLFSKRTCVLPKERVKVLGSLSFITMSEYIRSHNEFNEQSNSQFSTLRSLGTLDIQDRIEVDVEYETAMSLFLLPFIDLSMPLLIRSRRSKDGKINYGLFYVEGINPNPGRH